MSISRDNDTIDAGADLYALTYVSENLASDWYKPGARDYLIDNFDKWEADFDRIHQIVEKIREIRSEPVVIDPRRAV